LQVAHAITTIPETPNGIRINLTIEACGGGSPLLTVAQLRGEGVVLFLIAADDCDVRAYPGESRVRCRRRRPIPR
jgi:hypothetical protein